MKNKLALITGVTSGIGLATAKKLCEKGMQVIGVYRSEEKLEIAKKDLNDNCHFIKGDLSSQNSLKDIAEKTKAFLSGKGLDVLINNAGAFFSHYKLSDDGVEMQFAVNTIAPIYLSMLLYDDLEKADGRIVNVNSSSHYGTRIKFNDLQLSRSYSQLRAYKQTKLFSVMLSREFNKHSKHVKMYMADPGLVNTEMGFKNTFGIAKFVWKVRKNSGQPPEIGAETSVYLATTSDLPNKLYWKDCQPKRPNPNALKDDDAKIIWNSAEKICGMKFVEILE